MSEGVKGYAKYKAFAVNKYFLEKYVKRQELRGLIDNSDNSILTDHTFSTRLRLTKSNTTQVREESRKDTNKNTYP